MKNLLSFLASILIITTLLAQAPQALNYQAVARDNAGVILANTNLDVRFTVKQTTATGTTVFQETHATSTDALGGFSLEIGRGTASTGSFTAINWSAGPYFLEVELDVNSSGSYTSMGTSEMLSVPYALYAETAGSIANFNNNTPCIDTITISDPRFTFNRDTIGDLNNDGLSDYAAYIVMDTSFINEITDPDFLSKTYINGVMTGVFRNPNPTPWVSFAATSPLVISTTGCVINSINTGDIVKCELIWEVLGCHILLIYEKQL